MEFGKCDDFGRKKKVKKIDREMNAALFMLRCCQCGIAISDLDYLSIGMVLDIFTEQQNDDYEYPRIATKADIDRL